MSMMETELAETKAALAEALAAKGKLLSLADGEKLQKQVKHHETMRSQAIEESREALKKCNDMAQALAAERAKCIQLLEEQHREREATGKMRSAFTSFISLMNDVSPDLIPAAATMPAVAAVSSPSTTPPKIPEAVAPTPQSSEAAPSPDPPPPSLP